MRGRIGRLQHHFSIISQGGGRLGREMLVLTWLTALKKEMEEARRGLYVLYL